MITQNIPNYNYAPGIATYGTSGKTGADGTNGNNLFYTDFDLENNTDVRDLITKLKNKKVPIKKSDDDAVRDYIKGDYFFTTNGLIWRLNIDINEINSDESSDEELSNVFVKEGIIKLSSDGLFAIKYIDNRLVFDTSMYKGLVIENLSKASIDVNNYNSALNIISNRQEGDNNVKFIDLATINSLTSQIHEMKIYYNISDLCFYIESEQPIKINGNIKVDILLDKMEYDNFSSIVTSEDPITKFKFYVDQISYDVSTIDSSCYLVLSDYPNDILNKDIYVKIYLRDKTYIYDTSTGLENGKMILEISNDDIAYIEKNEIKNNIKEVSMVNNTEIFVKKQ